MDDKLIINRVKDCETINYKDLKVIQGELKDLTKDKYTRFKKQIKKNGITSPVHVWDDNGVLKVLDGTQRKRLYGAMEEEGYLIPPVPIVKITADSEKQAKNILLGLASQYGEVNEDGLYAFALEAGISLEELGAEFALPGIDLDKFGENFGPEEASKAGNLAAKFGAPPFSILDARQGWWQERKRQWIEIGIQSELGRGGGGIDGELQKPGTTLGATPPNQKALYGRMKK